jgi:predicted RNase H-like HicB family nuclease
MQRFRVEVTVEKDGERFHAFCPALPGLHVDGDTAEEALECVKDAAIVYLESMLKHGEALPIACIVPDGRRAAARRTSVEFAVP